MKPGLNTKMQTSFKAFPSIKKIGSSLVFKVTALVVILIMLVSWGTNFIIYNRSYNAIETQIREKLMMIASNATVTLDGEKLKTLKSSEDEGNPTYLELQKILQEVKEASQGKIKYVYTIAKTGDKYTYVLDAAPIEDKDNHSALGSEFDIVRYPKAMEAFEHPTSEEKPTYDEDFKIYSQSGYAPIKDKDGKVIGILGVDMDVTTIQQELANINKAGIYALIFAFALALILGIIFSKYLTKPILLLTKVTRAVADGDLDASVTIKRNDEFGQLAEAFNSMTADLKESHETLKRYNLELEDKVAKRTAELSMINKEIKDILDNMSQAIFTIDSDLKFNEQHSRYANEIFGDICFANRPILETFFVDDTQNAQKDSLENWLRKIFSNEGTSWENLEALQPVNEVAVKVINHKGQELTKYIHFSFKPITDIFEPNFQEMVTKIMVIVQDITDKKALEQEMEKKEQEYKDNINQIVEIIKMDKELFEDFITDCKENLAKFEPLLIDLRNDKTNTELVNNLFRIMHTLKGNARMFNLERIAGEAHSIENIFSAIRKGEKEMTEELLTQTFAKLDRFNLLFNETIEVYNKIVQGKSMDTGKTRPESRVAEESEVIKVKVQEINRLAELIKIADRLIVEDVSKSVYDLEGKQKVEEVGNIFKETEKQIQAIQKISITRLFTRFPRMARDISIELGKKINLIMKESDIQLDKNIFERIADPLIHIVRNSLDHGIETPEERKAAGKPEEGIIKLEAHLEDTSLLIEVIDDGRGLDLDKIKTKAVKNGLVSSQTALEMTDEEAINLIFHPGLSTKEKITSISGRGVGMDVVKNSIEEHLNGTITIQSKKNEGMKVILKIPMAS